MAAIVSNSRFDTQQAAPVYAAPFSPSARHSVLEYFDAVKIGLTATPTLHTVSILGDPIY
jgi:type I site-specific restriction endonuclease